jgi:polysaccharide biosynthesis transport protein
MTMNSRDTGPFGPDDAQHRAGDDRPGDRDGRDAGAGAAPAFEHEAAQGYGRAHGSSGYVPGAGYGANHGASYGAGYGAGYGAAAGSSRGGYGQAPGYGMGPGTAYGHAPSGGDLEFSDERILTLRDYLTMLRRHRWLVIVVTVLAVASTLTWSLTRTPQYAAQALITVTPVVGVETSAVPTQTSSIQGLQSQIDVLASSPTRERVELLIGPVDIVTFSQSARDSSSIRITATSPDPRRAALVANTYAEVFADVRREGDLERNARAAAVVRERFDEISLELRLLGVDPIRGSESTDPRIAELLTLLRSYTQQERILEDQAAFIAQGRVAVVDPAAVPERPFSPQPLRDGLLSLLVGLMGGFGLALLRDHFRDSIQDDLDVRRATGMRPLVGRIPTWRLPTGVRSGAITLLDPTSIAAEAYRELSTNVRFLVMGARGSGPGAHLDDRPWDPDAARSAGGTGDGRRRASAVMLVSAGADNGKTATAVNLAITAARSGQRVVLVDADLRRTSVAAFFGLGRLKGLSDAIIERTEAINTLIAVGVDNLRILPAGTIPPNPTDLLAGRGMERIHAELSAVADLIIYDTPAALAVPDVLEIGRLVDGAVLVLRHRLSTRREVSATIERLETLGIPVIGTVLNGIDTRSDAYYQYYSYYYRSGYATDDDPSWSPSRRERRRDRRAARAEERDVARTAARPGRSASDRRARAQRYGTGDGNVGGRFIPDAPVLRPDR